MYAILRPVLRWKLLTRFVKELLEIQKLCAKFGGKAVRDCIANCSFFIESIPFVICFCSVRQIRTKQNDPCFWKHSFCVSEQHPIGFLKQLSIRILLLRHFFPRIINTNQD